MEYKQIRVKETQSWLKKGFGYSKDGKSNLKWPIVRDYNSKQNCNWENLNQYCSHVQEG